MLTGDFTLSATDVSGFGLSVSRTASSRRPTAGADSEGQAAIFGPQWTSGTTAEITDSDWAYVRKTSATSVALVDVDGAETGFTATSSGGWKPEPGSEDVTLTGALTGSFTLKDDGGTTTTFAKVDSAATTWQVSSTYVPADNATTKVVSEKVTSGSSTLARPKYGRPEWADMVCSTGPAGSITGGGSNPTELPTKTVEYDRWGNTAKLMETANSVTRTTTNTYDAAGRIKTTSVSGGVGTAVPDSTTTYDADSGDVATVASNGQTITHTYDQLGREIPYNDGAGNTATNAYDALGRPVKTTDSAPSTTTYTYDTTKDPRGLETSRTDSVAGTFTASYDADGELATESLPGGYTLTVTQDEAGTETSRVYTKDSDGTVVASDTVDHSVHGQVVTGANTAGQSRTRYSYDAAGRLTEADDTDPDGACTRRDYTFDNNTNRTALAVATSDVGAACTSTGATTTSSSYDSADRLVTSGTVYDSFGRTTTQASGATIGYYAGDLVRQQTNNDKRQTWSLDAAGRLASGPPKPRAPTAPGPRPGPRPTTTAPTATAPTGPRRPAPPSPATSRTSAGISAPSPAPRATPSCS
ncbi:hypothetical protein RMT89_11720 [Streptomyces sp. P17]|nr:hypothetical protein [Streptomyces sp. P17]MDT9696592.1 hypothetical protein [Streptomyces sp. P17]